MSITDAELEDFIVRWENAFGERLTRSEAQCQAERLLNFFRLISQPLPKGAQPEAEGPQSD